ncbi:hypothetical protein A0H76_89 [Hepatospora eriocheir]|uniref:Uncharacterized protein n=1 Tax=Hepatospora eriocheir TaxID=1081669 RepID=A0A1X0QJG0_9MICR|nr:hypothetical protein A0H76_89 [Hepatospora eriocheir]
MKFFIKKMKDVFDLVCSLKNLFKLEPLELKIEAYIIIIFHNVFYLICTSDYKTLIEFNVILIIYVLVIRMIIYLLFATNSDNHIILQSFTFILVFYFIKKIFVLPDVVNIIVIGFINYTIKINIEVKQNNIVNTVYNIVLNAFLIKVIQTFECLIKLASNSITYHEFQTILLDYDIIKYVKNLL